MEVEVKPPDNAANWLLNAGDAAVSWWREHKPRGWSISRHLQNPTVNCVTFREKRLARAAARWYAVTHPSALPSQQEPK